MIRDDKSELLTANMKLQEELRQAEAQASELENEKFYYETQMKNSEK